MKLWKIGRILSVVTVVLAIAFISLFATYLIDTSNLGTGNAVAAPGFGAFLIAFAVAVVVFGTASIIIAIKCKKERNTNRSDINSSVSENFLRFKHRMLVIRVIKSCAVALSVGIALFGIGFILVKRCIVDFPIYVCIIAAVAAAASAFLLAFFLCRRSDMSIARDLDSRFSLKARVETMLEYSMSDGDMVAMQREDADKMLADIKTGSYGFKRIWIYAVAFLLCISVGVCGIVVGDLRNYVPPKEEIPFRLSNLQSTGLIELIAEVEGSSMEEQFRAPIAEELKSLHEKLKKITTYDEMQVALIESLAFICDITYESSSSTEMLDALWDTDNIYFKHLAKALDTSSWNSDSWGDFAESIGEYISVLMGDNEKGDSVTLGGERVRTAITGMIMKLDTALKASNLPEDDEMYQVIDKLFNNPAYGLSSFRDKISYMSDEEVRKGLVTVFDGMDEDIYAAVALNWINATTGEYVMTRLSGLFSVPIPEFERPGFVKRNESVGGSIGNTDEGNAGGGGIGEGETFGSDDIVLDYKTGEYKKYGDLINEYSAIMNEKLADGNYTDEQKEMIKKYFALLYSGIKKEGN